MAATGRAASGCPGATTARRRTGSASSTPTRRRSVTIRIASRSARRTDRARRPSPTSWERPRTAWATRSGTGSSSRTGPASASGTCRPSSRDSPDRVASSSSSTSSRSARHGRPTEPTVDIPDATKIEAAFRAVGRTDIDPATFPQGEQGLEIERSVEAFWAPQHVAALERAMPWTSAHMTSAAGGVEWAARAIAGYFDALWGDVVGRPLPTTVSATAPRDGALNVPATGWVGELLTRFQRRQPRWPHAHRRRALARPAVSRASWSRIVAERASGGLGAPA